MDKKSAKGEKTMVTREEGWSNNNGKFGDDIQGERSITIPQELYSDSHEISENEIQWLNSSEKCARYRDYGSSQQPKIQMVPQLHREIESNIKCYEPVVVAIGPYHRGKLKLKLMEKKKELLAFRFAKPESTEVISRKPITTHELYKRVKDIVPNVRKCYDENLIEDYSDEEFAKMMFLDGCFILQYIYCLVNANYKQLQMKSSDIAFIRRDLFLLENQIPFVVLQVLMSCRFENGEGMKMIQTFISSGHVKPPKNHGFIQGIKDFFLDFFGGSTQHPESYTCTQKIKNFFGKIFEGETPSNRKPESLNPTHLLELSIMQLIDPEAFSEGGCFLKGEWYTYRSTQELRRAGIQFKPGKSRRLSDVKFNSFYCSGLLTLPPITIDDSTKLELLNIVAYEAGDDTPDDFGVTSYLCFMDSLIRHAEDVKELRSKGILLNFLGSDEEVVELFNEIARDLVPNPHAFIEVNDKIEKYCSAKRTVLISWMVSWMVDIKKAHFSSPLTVTAFITALFVTGLQIIQTYYTVYPK